MRLFFYRHFILIIYYSFLSCNTNINTALCTTCKSIMEMFIQCLLSKSSKSYYQNAIQITLTIKELHYFYKENLPACKRKLSLKWHSNVVKGKCIKLKQNTNIMLNKIFYKSTIWLFHLTGMIFFSEVYLVTLL